MSVLYSQYGTGSTTTDSDIVANESYTGLSGAFQMIAESADNEHAIFEAVIGQDFAEAWNKINPAVVSESQLEAIQEASVKGIWSKVVEFVKKLGEKIMGIIKTLKDKIQMAFIKDGKELVKKYGKQVNTAYNQGKLSKMKFKYAKVKTSGVAGKTLEDAIGGSKLMTELNARFDQGQKTVYTISSSDDGDAYDASKGAGDEYKPYTTDQRTEILDAAFGSIVGGSTDSKNFEKDFDEAVFEDAEDIEGLDSTMLALIVSILEGNKGANKTLDSNEKATRKTIKEIETKAKKVESESFKKFSEKSVTKETARVNATAGKVITLCNIYSTVAGRYYGTLGNVIKKEFKQARAAFTKAATYNPKQSANEQVDFLTAVAEASDWEVDMLFDGVELA